jgi:methyltransferase-like protein 6
MSLINDFWRTKYFRETSKCWNNFYKRNSNKFFKDRHWTTREFQELNTTEPLLLLEVGCGVGNFAIPLLAEKENLQIYFFDVAPSAVAV